MHPSNTYDCFLENLLSQQAFPLDPGLLVDVSEGVCCLSSASSDPWCALHSCRRGEREPPSPRGLPTNATTKHNGCVRPRRGSARSDERTTNGPISISLAKRPFDRKTEFGSNWETNFLSIGNDLRFEPRVRLGLELCNWRNYHLAMHGCNCLESSHVGRWVQEDCPSLPWKACTPSHLCTQGVPLEEAPSIERRTIPTRTRSQCERLTMVRIVKSTASCSRMDVNGIFDTASIFDLVSPPHERWKDISGKGCTRESMTCFESRMELRRETLTRRIFGAKCKDGVR